MYQCVSLHLLSIILFIPGPAVAIVGFMMTDKRNVVQDSLKDETEDDDDQSKHLNVVNAEKELYF